MCFGSCEPDLECFRAGLSVDMVDDEIFDQYCDNNEVLECSAGELLKPLC